MKHTLVALVLLAPVLPSHAVAQAAPASHTRAEIVSAARDVMQKARYCTLVTIGQDGQPQARISTAQESDKRTFAVATHSNAPAVSSVYVQLADVRAIMAPWRAAHLEA